MPRYTVFLDYHWVLFTKWELMLAHVPIASRRSQEMHSCNLYFTSNKHGFSTGSSHYTDGPKRDRVESRAVLPTWRIETSAAAAASHDHRSQLLKYMLRVQDYPLELSQRIEALAEFQPQFEIYQLDAGHLVLEQRQNLLRFHMLDVLLSLSVGEVHL